MKNIEKNEGISIVVPVFNEVSCVTNVINNLLNVLETIAIPNELIIVDDGSTDGTEDCLEEISNRITMITHSQNRGYGAALKTGIRHASYPIIAITDADETYPNEELPNLLNWLKKYDMVVGSRTGEQAQISLVKYSAKWLLTKLANYLLEDKIDDINSGFRIFRKKTADKFMHILPNRFSFTTTITLAMISDGYRIKYVPINYFKRSGKSKIKPIDAMGFLILIIRMITYFNPLRFFLPLALFLFCLGLTRLCYDLFWLRNLTDSTTLLFLFSLQVSLIGIVADLVVKRKDF